MESCIRGKARVDSRTKDLVKRLSSRDIAFIDHSDLDELAAAGLVRCRPRAVFNWVLASGGDCFPPAEAYQ